MGTNGGNGMAGGPGHETGGSNGRGHPAATEYTLQGVMRFLQTEWHRHERDRNGWEIEKLEMKARIAKLEGSLLRSDHTQNALKKYVKLLERKIKEQKAQLKEGQVPEAGPEKAKMDRLALMQDKMSSLSPSAAGLALEMDGIMLNPNDDEATRNELKTFLDRVQNEFSYLMMTPANPLPPRESPLLPSSDDVGDHEAYAMLADQQQQPAEHAYPQQFRQSHAVRDLMAAQAGQIPRAATPNHNHHPPANAHPADLAVRNAEGHAALMARSATGLDQGAGPLHYSLAWPRHSPATNRTVGEAPGPRTEQGFLAMSEHPEDSGSRPASLGGDGWDFNETHFPDPGPSPLALPMPTRPDNVNFPTAGNLHKPPNRGALPPHLRKGSASAGWTSAERELLQSPLSPKGESGNLRLRFGLRGHLDTVRTVIFSGGGSPGEPEICTAGDDGMIKRFHISDRPQNQDNDASSDLDVTADFTHRGHSGAVLCLASWLPSLNFTTGGRAQGDGWIFSGGQDSTIRVWERGRVDPKATLDGHTDAVWALCVLPATLGTVFGPSSAYGNADRILLVSGAADGTIRVWAVSAPPQLGSPQPGSIWRGRGGRIRGNSVSSGSAFPSSPQPTTASNSLFSYTLIHAISRANSKASPTCIAALGPGGESFVVSFSDASIIVYETRSGEQMVVMASLETYDATCATSVNAVVATTAGLDQHSQGSHEDEADSMGGPTGGGSGVEGVIISGHEDRFVRFFDANSGQCTYNMLAHPASISSLSLSPDGRELVSAGHDASLRFWSLEKRSCTQEITSHRIMRGEGVCAVVWSLDGQWVVSGGGDGLVKVFAR